MNERKILRREALGVLARPLVGLYGGAAVALLVGIDRLVAIEPVINEVNAEIGIPSEQEITQAREALSVRATVMSEDKAHEILRRANPIKQEQLLKERGVWERKKVGEVVGLLALLGGAISGFRYKP